MDIQLTVNGEQRRVAIEPWQTLLDVLRDELGLKGTKSYCHAGACGACTVLLDGEAATSCSMLATQVREREVTTIEGLAPDGTLHPIQQAFIDHWGLQCGYCTPGMVLLAKSLLDANPDPSREEIKQALAGNLCRCTGYLKIFEAVELAAAHKRGEQAEPSKESIYGS